MVDDYDNVQCMFFCSHIQCVIDNNALPAFVNLLQHPKNTIQKEACWTISNITAGNQNQIQSVIDAGLVPYVIRVLAEVGIYLISDVI